MSYKLNEEFTDKQIEMLRKEYETLQKMDVTSKAYKNLIVLLNKLDQKHLKRLASANIKFVSALAKNRVKKSTNEDAQVTKSSDELQKQSGVNERCWDGYKPTPGKKAYEKGSCMKEDDDLQEEAEHEGKKVTLNKPFRTPDGPKKFAVYVKNDKGNVVKVTFGDPNMEIKRDDPDRRSNYRARHNCSDPGPKWKANYWSCKMWADKPVSKLTESEGETRFDFDTLDGPRTAKKIGAVIGIKGESPEDALKHYLIPYGYRKFEITAKAGIIIVKGQWGANPKDVEYHYYRLVKVISEAAPPDAKIEKWIKSNKERFKKEYGEDKGTEVLYAKAWKMYNNK